MPDTQFESRKRRDQLLKQIQQYARKAVFGTPSETYRTCGTPTCRCHGPGPKHGPHLYINFRGQHGKTTGYYVPKAAHKPIREGVTAWQSLQDCLRELAEINKQNVLDRARRARP